MKREFKLFFIILSLFLLVGCSSDTKNNDENKVDSEKGQETIVYCELENNNSEDYSLNSSYKIYSENGIVNKVITVETLESESEDILAQTKKQVTELYDTASEKYGGYTYDIKIKDNQLISTVQIDYNEMNLKEYVKDNPIMEAFTKDNKMTLTGITSLYKSLGAKCE